MVRDSLNRTSVLRAAADLADREGFEEISISALARTLGVQPASLYSHIRDRAAVLDGIHELALAELADRIAQEIAGRSGYDALAGLATAHRRYAQESPGRWTALQRPAAAETAGSEAATRLVSLNWAVLRDYGLPDDQLVHATRFVGATINGFIALERQGGFAHRTEQSDESWQHALDAIDRSLRSWPRNEGVTS